MQPEEVKIAMDWMGAKSTNCMTEAKQSSPGPKLETVQCHIKRCQAQKLVKLLCKGCEPMRLCIECLVVHSKTNDEGFSSSVIRDSEDLNGTVSSLPNLVLFHISDTWRLRKVNYTRDI